MANALLEGVLAKRRPDNTGLGVCERHRKRAGVQDRLQALCLIKREGARDGDIAIRDGGLHCWRRLHDAVEHDSDLALRRGKLGRDIAEDPGTFAVERDIHDILARRGLGDRGLRDIGAIHEGGVGAISKLDILLAIPDLQERIRVADIVETDELDMSGLADGLDGGLCIRRTRNLDEDGICALLLHGRLGSAERVHAVLDNRCSGSHIIRARLRAIRLRGRQDDGDAALDIETLIDGGAKRREGNHAGNADRCENDERRYPAAGICAQASLRA